MQAFQKSAGAAADFSLWQILSVLVGSFVLSMLLSWSYKTTHRGISYSVSFVHTLIITAVTVSIIMMIIGTNIARAFTLVGALSIIRFRTAIKDPRDVAFIFAAMAAGMACGTGFFLLGAIFVLFLIPMTYFLFRFDIGSMPTSEMLLRVQLPENIDYRTAFDSLFQSFLSDQALLSIESIQGGTALELVYSIHFKKGASEKAFLEGLRGVTRGGKVTLLSGQQNVNV
jgi:hypothetical protein